MKKDNRIYINHILESINNIEEYVKDVSGLDSFVNNKIVRDAVLRNFEIIGEAANHIDKEYIKEHAEIGWEEIVGLRNLLIHEYFGVDLEIVWNTIKRDLPGLKKQIEKLLSSK